MENKQINYIENDIVNDFTNDETVINDYESEIAFEDLLKYVAKRKNKKEKNKKEKNKI